MSTPPPLGPCRLVLDCRAEYIDVYASVHQKRPAGTVRPQYAEHEVTAADAPLLQPDRLAQRQPQRLLRLGGERDVPPGLPARPFQGTEAKTASA